MQQEDDLRGLAKVMEFMRAISIIFAVIHVYWYCYQATRNLTAALPRSLLTVRSSHSHIPFGQSFSFQSTTGGICHNRRFNLSAKRKIKSRHISTLIIDESFALASNQMLICDGFESFKRPYCLRRLNSTLNSTKK